VNGPSTGLPDPLAGPLSNGTSGWPPAFVLASRPARPPSAWQRWGRNLLLFALTVLSVAATGALQSGPLDGLLLAAGLMPILLAHEFGHYLTARRYRLDATLPFFIPLPLLSLVGTLGAFIRIRSPFRDRRSLFDVGIAGPLAGFVVCIPVLVLGAAEARIVPDQPSSFALILGEPLLFQWAVRLVLGPVPEGMTVLIGPLGMAAWFGLLVTALNLIPVGQLDGGHVAYALLRGHARIVARLALLGCLGLLYLQPTWLVWCVLLLLLGRPHPPTLFDEAAVGRVRWLVGGLGVALCFTPSPIVVSLHDFLQAFR
jgi:membrane-associated protease RseP (regulator of RpoE activity)